MKLKKGTDVYEIESAYLGINMMIMANGKNGRNLTQVLKALLGSPALEDYGKIGFADSLTITRRRLGKDTKLEKD